MGHPPIRVLPAVPNTNRGLIENLFLLTAQAAWSFCIRAWRSIWFRLR